MIKGIMNFDAIIPVASSKARAVQPADADALLRMCEPTATRSLQDSNNIRRQMESLAIVNQQSLNL